MSSIGLTRAETLQLRKDAFQSRKASKARSLRPPPKVNPTSTMTEPTQLPPYTTQPISEPIPINEVTSSHLASPTRYTLPPEMRSKPVIPKTLNNINPVPTVPSSSLPPPTYLTAPFGVSGTLAPNPTAELRLRNETNVPPDVNEPLRKAKPTSTETGDFYNLQKPTSNVKAPELGSNPSFDAKVLQLQSELRSGGDLSSIERVVDGSTAPPDPFEDEVRNEMTRLEKELREEVKRMSPVKETGGEGREVLKNDDKEYGRQLLNQIEDRKNLLNSEKTTQLEMDVLAKRQDLERQHNQILIKKQHQEKLMEKRKEQMEEKQAQMRYKVELDRQMASKENMKLQENLSRRQDTGTGLNFPSERSELKVKYKSPLRQQHPSPRPTLTRKGELEKEYSIQASLDRETLRSDEDKSRRIQDFQNSRAYAKSVEVAEKLKKQQEYAEQLNSQLAENREIKSDRNERQYEGEASPKEDEVRREQRRQQVEYADQLKRQMEEKQQLQHLQANNDATPAYLQSPTKQHQQYQQRPQFDPSPPPQIKFTQHQNQPYDSNTTPAYLQSPTKPSQQHLNPRSPRVPDKYVSPKRVPPHKTPPVSPRLFPSEQPNARVTTFGTGLSTLYGDVVGGKSEQRLQTKAEYKRYLERQMREKEQRRNIERGDRIKEEKSLLSPPPPNAVPRQVHVSPAYEDHLQTGSTYQTYNPPVTHAPVVYQHQPSTGTFELNRKAEYARLLREQMEENESRKKREKEEQRIYDEKYESPGKVKGDVMQIMGSPDEFVDGPFGRRRLGGGGDPGGVTDLKYRNNLIRKVSQDSEDASHYQNHNYNSQYPQPTNHLSPDTNNAATRQKMVADVYGTTQTGAALGFGRNVSPHQRPPPQNQGRDQFQQQYNLQPQLHQPEPVYQPEQAWGTGPSITSQPKNSNHHSKANLQRLALVAQMEEKRVRVEAEKQKQKEEDLKEWKRIEEENLMAKEEEERAKDAKKLEEQKQLEYLTMQQEKAAIKRRNGVVREEREAKDSTDDNVQETAKATPRVRKAPAPPPKVQPQQHQELQQQQQTPLRSTEQAGLLLSVEKRERERRTSELSPPTLKPGDFFHVDDPEVHLREASPFTKNMEILRSSVEDDFSQPLQDFQHNLHSNVVRKAFKEKHESSSERRNPYYPPGSPRLEDADELEQSLRADSQFHMVPKAGGQLPFGETMTRTGPGELTGSSQQLEGDALEEQNEGDPMDSFVAQWQVANGFSATTGGYAPHRKLLHTAKAEGQLPNFAALRQMNSNRNFATGNAESLPGMARVAAPPVVHAQDALRSTLMASPPGANLSSNSDFITDDIANVSEVFNVNRNRNNLAEQSLKSESLLMYIKDSKRIEPKMNELQAVGEEYVEEPTPVNLGGSGFHVTEIRDVFRGDSDSDDEDEVLVVPVSPGKGMAGPPVSEMEEKEEGGHFKVSTVTDEEREAMLEQQRAKWDVADEETYGNEDFEKDVQEKEEDVEALPRTNSEMGVLEKLRELEEKLGIVDGEADGEEGGGILPDTDDDYEEDDEVAEEEAIKEKEKEARRSFTERWLGTDSKAGDVSESKERKSFNAELIFVGKEEEVEENVAHDDDDDASEVSSGTSDGSVSPPSSPTRQVASNYVAATQYVGTVIASSLSPRSARNESRGSDKVASEVSSEGSMSPPGSATKNSRQIAEKENDQETVNGALERIKGKIV
ncbi:hypothetical protein TrST_g4302 [Triparma strigata]|uniref:Uncharacterized protein n=2 Tax=Triparma strigata TaxID=1606541 RepID=A0A9W7AWH0_9STRA|nr:hypothetical protein TrST_g4302 [Triparma strigata]